MTVICMAQLSPVNISEWATNCAPPSVPGKEIRQVTLDSIRESGKKMKHTEHLTTMGNHNTVHGFCIGVLLQCK